LGNKITPYEALLKKQPDPSNLRVFGCLTYIHNDDQTIGKFDNRAIKGIFVRYATNSKGWQIYLLDRRKIVYSRNITFWESSETPQTTNRQENIVYDVERPTIVDANILLDEKEKLNIN
jgi:hypothetical protein